MEFDWTREDREFRSDLQTFLDETLPENWDELSKGGPGSETQARFSKQFCRQLAERGWLTQHWPAAYGGGDAGAWRHIILGEEMWSRGEPRGPQYMNVNWIGPSIMKYGTEEQKREHLPRISQGDELWCQGFSEPEAGSDLVALRTLAIRQDDAYVVNGSKIWTSYADNAEYCFLLVRTDPESKRHRGISVLLMRMDLPGVEIREIPSVVGERYFHEVFLTDVKVPVSCRLGPENEGWEIVSYALQYERVGAPRYARAELTIDLLAEHARCLGRLDDPNVLEKLGEARSLCEAARLLTYRVVDQREHDMPPTPDSNVTRVAGTMADRAVSELALEVFGDEALEYGSVPDSNFRMAMTAGVAVGTTEVQLNLIANRFLGLPKE